MLNFPLIIVTPNESMSFSAYYSNSRRSGRSRRFRVTPDSGERNLSLEERRVRGSAREGSGGRGSVFDGKTWYLLCFICVFLKSDIKRVLFLMFWKRCDFPLIILIVSADLYIFARCFTMFFALSSKITLVFILKICRDNFYAYYNNSKWIDAIFRLL